MRLSRKEEGEVTHAVTHTPHPTHPSGRITGRPPPSRASAFSPTGQARAHTRRDAPIGAHGHLVQQPAERVAEEPAAVVGARVHQKLGERLTCHRNASRPFPGALSAANRKGATTSGTSNRSVQSRSPSWWRVTRPSPPSYRTVDVPPGLVAGTASVSTTPASAKPMSDASRRNPWSRRPRERAPSPFTLPAQRPPRSRRNARRLAFPGAW